MEIYTLIAYKSDGDDYCKSCHMARYNSDLIIFQSKSKEEIAGKWAAIEDQELGTGEDGYSIGLMADGYFLNYGLYYDDSVQVDAPEEMQGLLDEEFTWIKDRTKEIIEERKLAREEAARKAEETRKKQSAAQKLVAERKKEESERAKLRELAEKYPEELA